MGAIYMGNRPILKVDSRVSVVMDQVNPSATSVWDLKLLFETLSNRPILKVDSKVWVVMDQVNPKFTCFTSTS
jgi:hypothetical protein